MKNRVLKGLGLGPLVEDVGLLEGVFSLALSLLLMDLQSPPSNMTCMLMYHSNAVNHAAGLHPPLQHRAFQATGLEYLQQMLENMVDVKIGARKHVNDFNSIRHACQ